mmetsp:Transcript_20456/g.55827  ORF Transcript_20456/g.55827 Transcript_20456/m.55827 type:complete len:266 (+) Transcript_20456:976-1773(+)
MQCFLHVCPPLCRVHARERHGQLSRRTDHRWPRVRVDPARHVVQHRRCLQGQGLTRGGRRLVPVDRGALLHVEPVWIRTQASRCVCESLQRILPGLLLCREGQQRVHVEAELRVQAPPGVVPQQGHDARHTARLRNLGAVRLLAVLDERCERRITGNHALLVAIAPEMLEELRHTAVQLGVTEQARRWVQSRTLRVLLTHALLLLSAAVLVDNGENRVPARLAIGGRSRDSHVTGLLRARNLDLHLVLCLQRLQCLTPLANDQPP